MLFASLSPALWPHALQGLHGLGARRLQPDAAARHSALRSAGWRRAWRGVGRVVVFLTVRNAQKPRGSMVETVRLSMIWGYPHFKKPLKWWFHGMLIGES